MHPRITLTYSMWPHCRHLRFFPLTPPPLHSHHNELSFPISFILHHVQPVLSGYHILCEFQPNSLDLVWNYSAVPYVWELWAVLNTTGSSTRVSTLIIVYIACFRTLLLFHCLAVRLNVVGRGGDLYCVLNTNTALHDPSLNKAIPF